jgi:hypothetical protein
MRRRPRHISIQLDKVTVQSYFGISAEIRQDFPHGFITTKLFPASFCELGVERFKEDLDGLPSVVRSAVIHSLRERVEQYGLEYVVALRADAVGQRPVRR